MRALLQLILLCLVAGGAFAQLDITHAPDLVQMRARAGTSWKTLLLSYHALSDTNDSHGTFHTVTNFAPSTWSAGVNGNAFDVSGGNNGLQHGLTNFTLNATSYTISAWFKASSISVDQTIVAWSGFGGVALRIVGSKPSFNHYDGAWKTVNQTNTLSSGVWYHYVARYNHTNTTMTLFLDGVYKGQNTTANGCSVTTSPQFRIAQEGGYYYANGSIDEVAVWQRALTDAEIVALYNGGAGLFYSSF